MKLPKGQGGEELSVDFMFVYYSSFSIISFVGQLLDEEEKALTPAVSCALGSLVLFPFSP